MKTRQNNPSFPCLVCTVLAGAMVSHAHAGTEFFWSADASTNNLGTASNWVDGIAPATNTTPTISQNTDILVFTNAAMAGVLRYGGNRNLGGIEFRGPDVGSYTLPNTDGAEPRMIMTLGGRISMDANVAVPQTLNRLGFSGTSGSYTIENLATSPDATLTLATSIFNYSTEAMTLVLGGSNTGQNTINSVINENAGSGALTLEKNGSGIWVILSNNSHTGGTTLQEGVLAIRSSNALSSGPLTINGGAIGSVVVVRTVANSVTINDDFQLGGVSVPGLSNQATTFSGPVDLGGGTRTITLGNSATFNNTISNGGLVIESSSNTTLTLAGNSDYQGDTSVNGGSLRIDGDNSTATGTITVATGATLGGNGTSGGAVSISPGGGLGARITDWSGEPGIGYDDLDVASLNAGSDEISVVVNTTGLTNFTEADQSFTILNASGGITGFNPALVGINAPGFPGTGTWALVQAGDSLVLEYKVAIADPFLAWIDGFEVADKSKGGDPDEDGISNLMEFVLNGNPGISDRDTLPEMELTSTDFIFSYVRREDSKDVDQVVQYGSDLTGWTDVIIPAAAGQYSVGVATVTVDDGEPASGPDTVTVSIPRAEVVNGKLFARLMVGP